MEHSETLSEATVAPAKAKDFFVYICQPSYGNGNKHSKRAFWAGHVLPNDPYAGVRLCPSDVGFSLLPEAFNAHWKQALNMQLDGVPIARFVMLHDDVVPEDGWAGKLLAELDATGADVISAVIPFKDITGRTSTAIDDPNDPYGPFRRLTMSDVFKLPKTFTARDCTRNGLNPNGAPLLVNSGCWVADFTKPWRTQVHFQISSRIMFVLAEDHIDRTGWHRRADELIGNQQYEPGMRGRFVSKVMSEDWDFSRQLATLGCDVRATRKIRIAHHGECPFNNWDGGWGTQAQDEELRCKFDPTYADIPQVEGWLTEAEGRKLAELAKGKHVLEIGSYCGKSTIWMARVATHVTAVDVFDDAYTAQTRPPDGKETPLVQTPLPTFSVREKLLANLARHEVSDKVTVRAGRSEDVVPRLRAKFDLIFIDGGHDRASVERDIEASLERLAPGGLLAFHDYGRPDGGDRDVTEAVANRIKVERWLALARVGSVLVVNPFPFDNIKESKNGKQRYEEPAQGTAAVGSFAGDAP